MHAWVRWTEQQQVQKRKNMFGHKQNMNCNLNDSMKQITNIPKIMFPAILVCLCLSQIIIIISFITLMFLLNSLISFTLDMLEFNRFILYSHDILQAPPLAHAQ